MSLRTDCGWDPDSAIKSFEKKEFATVNVTKAQLEAAGGFDLAGITVAKYTVPSGASSNIAISSLKNAVAGKRYKLIIANISSTHIGATFTGAKNMQVKYSAATTVNSGNAISASTTITGGEGITAETTINSGNAVAASTTLSKKTFANGNIIVYNFFTDGTNVYVDYEIYA